jgi:hypothetical protein
MFRQLLNLVVPLFNQIYILLRRGDALLRFLLKGVQLLSLLAERDCHRAVSFGVVPQGDLKHAAAAAAPAFQGFPPRQPMPRTP